MSSNNAAPSDRAGARDRLPRGGRAGDAITVRDLEVERGGRVVLRLSAFSAPRGQVTAVIGPNGSGKSTLLAALQLLIKPRRGELYLDGAPMWDDPLGARRRTASVFQEALLLSMSVRRNVETALGLHKVPRRERRPRAMHWLRRLGVDGLAERHARELSGGEAQRVSLARAFALEPSLLLLDEPFSALDAPTRAALIDDFAAIVHETDVTTVLVTHDRDEALRLADQVALLIAGTLRQSGPPETVFAAPADPEVAAFVGVENVWPGALRAQAQGVATYAVPGGDVDVVVEDVAAASALVCVRPEQITLDLPDGTGPPTSARNRLPARVVLIESAGALVRLRLSLGSGGVMVATLTRPSLESLALEVGSPVVASFKASAAHAIPHQAAFD